MELLATSCNGSGRAGRRAFAASVGFVSLLPLAIVRGGDAPPAAPEGGFAALVTALERQSDEARRALYVESELVAAEDVDRRWWLHSAVGRRAPDRASLVRWAAADRGTLSLAPYRPGGAEELLRVVEDPGARIEDRVWATRMLEDLGDAGMLPRLQALQGDQTVRNSRYGAPGERDTLGKYVQRTIRAIQARGTAK